MVAHHPWRAPHFGEFMEYEMFCDLHAKMFYGFWSLIDYFNTIMSNKAEIAKAEYKKVQDRNLDMEKQYFIGEELRNYFENEFIDITTSSMIINLSNRVEIYLKKLGNQIKKDKQLSVGFDKFNGSSIEKTKAFFSVYSIYNIEQEDLDVLEEVQKIRDCLVHCNGNIDDSRDKEFLKSIINDSNKAITINGEMVITENYCSKLLVRTKDIMVNIYKKAGYGMIRETHIGTNRIT